jgi:uncharacterized protein
MARRFPKSLVAVVAVLALSSPLRAQSTAQDSIKVDLARRILVASKAADMFVRTFTDALPSQKASTPDLPAVFWDSLSARATSQADSLIYKFAPAYTENLTVEELRALLAFYESPIGRRMTELQPQVTKRSMEIGQQWGMQLGFSVVQDLMKAGIIKP